MTSRCDSPHGSSRTSGFRALVNRRGLLLCCCADDWIAHEREEGMPTAFAKATLVLVALIIGPAAAASGQQKLDRSVLPIPEPNYPHATELDVRKAKAPQRFEVKAPDGAPNVLIILIDDMGFGVSDSFGGPVHMPTLEQLGNEGPRSNHFHTTSLCSPTRTALLSGRNHHMNNMGSITET